MHRYRSTALISLLLLLSWQNVFGQQAQTFIDSDSLEVGDLFHYILIIDKESETATIEYPAAEMLSNDDISVISREIFRITATRDSLVYDLQFFGIDDTVIPSLDIPIVENGIESVISTTEIEVYFKAVVQEDDQEFRPLKPIFEFGRLLWPYIIGLLLALLAGYFFYRKWANRDQTEESVSLPSLPVYSNPVHTLRKELDRLSGMESPLIRRDYKLFYSHLGDAIRLYFEDVYDIRALEMTSNEILVELRKYPADNQVIDITRKVLSEADIVKFAKFTPDTDQAKHALSIAYRFLEIVEESDRYRISQLQSKFEEQEMEKRELLKKQLSENHKHPESTSTPLSE